MMNSQVVFQDIESPVHRQQMTAIMDDLEMLSPSDAAVRATFRFLGGKFLADIKIASETLSMTTAFSAGAIGDLLDGVRSKVMDRILIWRSERFAC